MHHIVCYINMIYKHKCLSKYQFRLLDKMKHIWIGICICIYLRFLVEIEHILQFSYLSRFCKHRLWTPGRLQLHWSDHRNPLRLRSRLRRLRHPQQHILHVRHWRSHSAVPHRQKLPWRSKKLLHRSPSQVEIPNQIPNQGEVFVRKLRRPKPGSDVWPPPRSRSLENHHSRRCINPAHDGDDTRAVVGFSAHVSCKHRRRNAVHFCAGAKAAERGWPFRYVPDGKWIAATLRPHWSWLHIQSIYQVHVFNSSTISLNFLRQKACLN